MAKSISSCLLILIVVITVGVPMIDAKRCEKVLDPNNCDLPNCRQKCLQQFNGNGRCQESTPGSYACMCFYNCSSDNEEVDEGLTTAFAPSPYY
ncbi:putative defensin-like protein 165 [Tanacetum coccineum]|uniref:Defensin-like protein 165 n=1 Tax=Tanacetum coccineum TaxID=301880 RepID=A0ABQ5E186_9ASTR